jgi:hypothetical protein
MSATFHPWRRRVAFVRSQPAAIQPLLDSLAFIPDKKRWGFPFRRGPVRDRRPRLHTHRESDEGVALALSRLLRFHRLHEGAREVAQERAVLSGADPDEHTPPSCPPGHPAPSGSRFSRVRCATAYEQPSARMDIPSIPV